MSDSAGEFGERRGDPQGGADVYCEFEVSVAQILHEGVASDHYLSSPISLEAAHRSQPAFELTVISFYRVVNRYEERDVLLSRCCLPLPVRVGGAYGATVRDRGIGVKQGGQAGITRWAASPSC
jgi:hypothetical protein